VRSIEHPGEGGRGRGNIISGFLRHFLPKGHEISTGFVIDARRQRSRQMNLVIHYADHHPVFEIAGVKHFLVECVVAVIENKAAIRSARDLRDALENIRSVKQLDRAYIRAARELPLHPPTAEVSPRFRQSVFGAITTERVPTDKTLRRVLVRFLTDYPQIHVAESVSVGSC
jgi:uncharacterized protein YlxP (DUF503 family)